MTKKFRDLRAKMSPESQAKANEKAQDLLSGLPLAELRQAMLLSQEQLAAELNVRQPAVAKMEKKTDMYISTLRRFIEAMGGQLDIRAHFPDGDVRINQFSDLDKGLSRKG
ncbi:MAG: transcriptional regulator [Gammaproteobacteria bacterium]|nr:MAG: transcriptional regulator [Gammaproteobacteria bacterium]